MGSGLSLPSFRRVSSCRMKAFSPFRFLSRWNQRAAAVFLVLLLCTWLSFFVMGMFPLRDFNFFLGPLFLAIICGFLLFLIWLTILISPGIPQQTRPLRETGWRLAAAGGCLLLGITAATAGGGPHRLGTRFGGTWGVDLQPVRDLQHSPAVVALGKGRDRASLPRDLWPDSVTRPGPWPFDRSVPGAIEVNPTPSGPPSLKLHFGRGEPGVLVQNEAPGERNHPEDHTAVQWADDVWLCWNHGD
jgi:hypothetical protein